MYITSYLLVSPIQTFSQHLNGLIYTCVLLFKSLYANYTCVSVKMVLVVFADLFGSLKKAVDECHECFMGHLSVH